MSKEAMMWARRQRFSSMQLKAVVNVIAARADKKGATWVSQATLAEEVGLSDRRLRSHLKTLERTGVITRAMRNTKKGRLTDVITLTLHRDFDLSKDEVRAANLAEPTGHRVPVAGEEAHRKLLAEPTGHRVPGNTKGITNYPNHEEGISERVVSYSEGNERETWPACDEDDPFGANVVPFVVGGRG